MLGVAPVVAPRVALRPVPARAPRRAPALAHASARSLPGAPARWSPPSAPGRARPSRGSLTVVAVFERFTERAIKAVMLSQAEAKAVAAAEVCTEHLLLGLIAEDSSSPKGGYFGFSSLTMDRVRAAITERASNAGRKDVSKPTELPFSSAAKRAFEGALAESRSLGVNYISPEHVLAALLAPGAGGRARALAGALGVDADALKAKAVTKLRGEADGGGGASRQRAAAGGRAGGGDTKSVLAELTRDMCEEARCGRTDPVIGRDGEVCRAVQILARRTKSNPILIGEPGVGKTAIAEGLAAAIVTGVLPDGSPLPSFLENKRILSLDLGLVLAGAKERGELESRVTKMLAEINAAGDVILMIDEIHTLVGAGSIGGRGGGGGGGGMDIANLLKPPLARGGLQCIGATTLDEFRKHIEKDPALERRFQPVFVGEPSEAEAAEILAGLASRYADHHRVVYAPDAVAAAVSLSARYVPDRQLPDKAIDVLDEAGSRARIDAYEARKAARAAGGDAAANAVTDADVRAAYDDLAGLAAAAAAANDAGDAEEAAALAAREAGLRAAAVGRAADGVAVPLVTRADVEAVVAAWTRIPVETMAPDEKERLLAIGAALGDRVIGQDDAVKAVARALQRARAGLASPDRPIAGMLFSGPTGVGKTELTKALADLYFGSPDAMLRLDMSEYMERHTVAKLVGPPPGYVGYGEGGKLTEAVRRRPHCVVLLDEVEKAHPDVFNVLLQVLEDGRLTDSEGRTVSFKNCLLIMTSNIGSSVVAKGGASLGFDLGGPDDADARAYTRIRSLVMEELKGYFRPELLNRLDEVVVFRQLDAVDARGIAALELAKTADRVAARGLHLEVTAPLMTAITAAAADREYGARPLKRAIMRLVDDPLSDALLAGMLSEGDVARLDVAADGSLTPAGDPVVTVTSLKPGAARRRAAGETGLKSEVVYSSLPSRKAAKAKAQTKA